jgi:hypothetical protein
MAGSIFMHDLSQLPSVLPIECGAPATGFDEALMRRIAAALQRSLAGPPAAAPDIWTPIIAAYHRPFVDLLVGGELRAANDLLANMFATNLTYGFEQAQELFDRIVADPAHQAFIGNFAFDKLLSLAAALRAIPIQNAEQGDFLPILREGPNALLERIEAKLGHRVLPPRFQGGLFGLSTARGGLSERSVTGLYVARRIGELLDGVRNPSVCEIGGGAGYVAYYCSTLGLADYTIVDLPTVSAVQAFFLANNLDGGAERIVLSGEPDDRPDTVKLINGADFISGSRTFDLVVNVDSFPEINGPTLRGYLRHVRAHARRLLSVNQEARASRDAGQPGNVQECVGDVVDEIGGFRRTSRFLFWLRPGYVEETYETDSSIACPS